jgi:hypothetical protein
MAVTNKMLDKLKLKRENDSGLENNDKESKLKDKNSKLEDNQKQDKIFAELLYKRLDLILH